MKLLVLVVIAFSLIASVRRAYAASTTKHLFILSRQFNMAHFDPYISFTPTLYKALVKAHTVIVKDALSGQPVRRWYKSWKPVVTSDLLRGDGDLYECFRSLIFAAIKEVEINTATLIWMRIRDAKMAVADSALRVAWGHG